MYKYTIYNLDEECMEFISIPTDFNKSLKSIMLNQINIEILHKKIKDINYNNNIEYIKNNVEVLRVKSIYSIDNKIDRYTKKSNELNRNYNASLVLNDLIGIRFKFQLSEFKKENFPNIFNNDKFKIIDLSKGKEDFDGYKAIHIYYRKDNLHFPIEIQLWNPEDYEFNEYMHRHAYKKLNSKQLIEYKKFFDEGLIKNNEDSINIVKSIIYRDECNILNWSV